DFSAFEAAGSGARTSEREVIASRIGFDECAPAGWRGEEPAGEEADGRLIVYEISGTGFLRHMVRTIVGTLVEVGRGRRAPRSMEEVLRSGDRARAGPTAPPQGLFLVRVTYTTPGAVAAEP